MANIKKGRFTLNLGLVRLTGELEEEDRQCAWELYTELSTRVAITGKRDDAECNNFEGELYIESLESVYFFFREARNIMRKFPVGKIGIIDDYHLGVLISKALEDVLRPFLEKWQVDYRHWWENKSNPRIEPLQRQKEYPELTEFLSDWTSVRWLMRRLQSEIVVTYKLIDSANIAKNKK